MDPVFALSISGPLTDIGAVAGLVAIPGLAILSLLYFAQAREVKRLREWAGRAPERAQELQDRVAAQAGRTGTIPPQPARGVVAPPPAPAPPPPAAAPAGGGPGPARPRARRARPLRSSGPSASAGAAAAPPRRGIRGRLGRRGAAIVSGVLLLLVVGGLLILTQS